ncbi:hypothetical protein MHI48_03365 [Paenibacillus sp. FSL H7-0942]|uniref:Uncharacterized protein n=1 Tax=Paenibacillus amylolyticus TaxID=1451 RepID=A0ABD8AUY2_PAEAM|nr:MULTISPECIES: hypothetical protein [Paenibacillus]ETT40263.1 hypothetical protein C161_03439 [Paenibacillus sp. FSL R5-192]ETT46835.1 hypothetical protein C170_22354 [Paenibacillus sp. FSL H7-689]OME97925.1 hypothetical protein BK129_30480 [Paenibacillus amylolyticus]
MNILIIGIVLVALIIVLILINQNLKDMQKALLSKCVSQLNLSSTDSYNFIFLNYRAQEFQSIEEKLAIGTFQNTIVIFDGPEWLFKTKQKKFKHINLLHASTVMVEPSIYKTNVAYILNGRKLKIIENANNYL